MITRILLLTFALAGLSLFSFGQDKQQGPPPVEGKPTTKPDGLKVWELKQGTGAEAVNGKQVSVHYTGWLTNGTKFDGSVEGKPLTFPLGAGRVIKGWEEGVAGMKVGGKRRLEIPSDLAYGSRGYPASFRPMPR